MFEGIINRDLTHYLSPWVIRFALNYQQKLVLFWQDRPHLHFPAVQPLFAHLAWQQFHIVVPLRKFHQVVISCYYWKFGFRTNSLVLDRQLFHRKLKCTLCEISFQIFSLICCLVATIYEQLLTMHV